MSPADLQEKYSPEIFLSITNSLVKESFVESSLQIPVPQSAKTIKSIQNYGSFRDMGVNVFSVNHTAKKDSRVGVAQDIFKILRDNGLRNALVATYSDESIWRFSLITSDLELNKSGRVIKQFSNARRASFLLGSGQKTRTPFNQLIKLGAVQTLDELKKRFAVEVVNNEFYREIAKLYDELVGTDKQPGVLKHPHPGEESHKFAVRLIGRIIFSWFLREKKSDAGSPLLSPSILSRQAADETNYFQRTLSPLFFEVLNKPLEDRGERFKKNDFAKSPYLNGGLFAEHEDDYYKYSTGISSAEFGLVDVPDVWLRKLFDLLELYNFTVDENTTVDIDLSIDPEMLGRIFENLLARINPETGETVRKSTGSFYTPREIVEYMVDESLIEYLKYKTGVDEEKLRALTSYDLSDDKKYPVGIEEKERIIDALGEVTILDPACGSGAFPIGALQKIVFMLQQLDPDGKQWFKKQLSGTGPELRAQLEEEYANKSFDYIRKLGIIRESIFGVDIQPIATEISRLRCFLTLVVDENVSDDEQNRGVQELPNLDFKFVTANSLLPLPKKQGEQQSFFQEESDIENLKALREEYFVSHGEKKKALKKNFEDFQKNMVLRHINELKGSATDLYSALSHWEPFEHSASDWFDPEWMFGVKKGFDIILANPPYVRHRDLPKTYKDGLKSLYSTGNTTSDIYCYFYELAYIQLAHGGVGTYITSNKWLRAKYGQNIRKLFRDSSQIIEVVDLGPDQFNAAAVDTSVMIFRKTEHSPEHEVRFRTTLSDKEPDILRVTQRDLSYDGFSFGSKSSMLLLKKIEEQGQQISKTGALKLNYGVLTGRNEVKTSSGKEGVFIINAETRQGLIKADPKSKELISPILRGRDINRYKYEWADKYLITAYHGSSSLIDNYPAIKKHLTKYEITLKARAQVKRGDHHWMELDQNPSKAFMKEFSEEKIIFPIIASEPSFALDVKGYFHNDKAFHITGDHLNYILGFLNSKLANWVIKHYGPTLGSGGFEYRKIFVEKLPIVLPSLSNINHVKEIESAVDSILNAKSKDPAVDTTSQEILIDQLLYKIYGLAPEEIKIIESSI